MKTKREAKDTDDDKSFDDIGFEDLALHTMLDMFEFSAHSFKGLGGPYFWNGLGIDFGAPMPKEEVLEHALSVNADTIYLAHTHPLSNDDSLKFSNAKIDPRELIAFGYRPLPLGNRPSSGDISFLSQVKIGFASENIKVIGVVFSSGGVWEYDIQDVSKFDYDNFTKAYDEFYPVDGDGFIEEWAARSDYPSYYMELQKPKMHSTTYQTQLSEVKAPPIRVLLDNEILSKTEKMFGEHGISLNFHPYAEFGIDPQTLMRNTIVRWANTFHSH
jgi:hypothetical protein